MRANFNYESGVFIGGSKDISIAERLEQIDISLFIQKELNEYNQRLLAPAIYDAIYKVRNLSKDSVREHLWNTLWPILQKKIQDKQECISQNPEDWWEKECIEKQLTRLTETECLNTFKRALDFLWQCKYTRDRKQRPERLCYIALKEHNIINYAVLKLMNEKVCGWLLFLLAFALSAYLYALGKVETSMWWGGIFVFSYFIMGQHNDNHKEVYLQRYRCTLGASLLCFVVGGIKTFFYNNVTMGEDMFYLGIINLALVLYTYTYKAATKLGFILEE